MHRRQCGRLRLKISLPYYQGTTGTRQYSYQRGMMLREVAKGRKQGRWISRRFLRTTKLHFRWQCCAMKKFDWALRESTLREWSTLQAAPSWTVGLVGCRCLGTSQSFLFTISPWNLWILDSFCQYDCYGLFVTGRMHPCDENTQYLPPFAAASFQAVD